MGARRTSPVSKLMSSRVRASAGMVTVSMASGAFSATCQFSGISKVRVVRPSPPVVRRTGECGKLSNWKVAYLSEVRDGSVTKVTEP